jgi:hypothetical protein
MVMILEQLVEWLSGKGNRITWRKPGPGLLCPPHIPHDLTRSRTHAAAVGNLRLTAWAMARTCRLVSWRKFCVSTLTKQTNSVALSPRVNYTDWSTATCRRNLVSTIVDRGVSRGQRGGSPTVVNLSFLDRPHANSILKIHLRIYVNITVVFTRDFLHVQNYCFTFKNREILNTQRRESQKLHQNKQKEYPWLLDRKRTIPTKQPPLVVSTNSCGLLSDRHNRSPRPLISVS